MLFVSRLLFTSSTGLGGLCVAGAASLGRWAAEMFAKRLWKEAAGEYARWPRKGGRGNCGGWPRNTGAGGNGYRKSKGLRKPKPRCVNGLGREGAMAGAGDPM